MANARAVRFFRREPVDSSARVLGIDSCTVETNGGLRPETSRASRGAGDLYRLFDGLGIKMEECRIHIRVQARLDQLRLRHAVPAFMLHKYFDGRAGSELELLLQLRSCGNSMRQNVLNGDLSC
jgi:hypothetical protein